MLRDRIQLKNQSKDNMMIKNILTALLCLSNNSDIIILNQFRRERLSMAKKNPHNERLKKIYREYTRIKFKKYSLQFPRLRPEEVVSKILREWEALDQEAKDDLEKQYLARSGSAFLLVSSSSSQKRKKEEAQAIKKDLNVAVTDKKIKKGKPKRISPKVRVFQDKQSLLRDSSGRKDPFDRSLEVKKLFKESSDHARSDENKSGRKSTPDKNGSSSDLDYLKKAKNIAKRRTKKVMKERKRNEQFNFKKYYFEKVSSEHPKWDKVQVQTIVKLLWQRKKRSTGKVSHVSNKSLSGRQIYRKQKQSEGLLRQQIKYLWKALPHQSKRYWEFKGKGSKQRNLGRNVRKILNAGVAREDGTKSKSNFGWMQKSIK